MKSSYEYLLRFEGASKLDNRLSSSGAGRHSSWPGPRGGLTRSIAVAVTCRSRRLSALALLLLKDFCVLWYDQVSQKSHLISAQIFLHRIFDDRGGDVVLFKPSLKLDLQGRVGDQILQTQGHSSKGAGWRRLQPLKNCRALKVQASPGDERPVHGRERDGANELVWHFAQFAGSRGERDNICVAERIHGGAKSKGTCLLGLP
jgi:hypothetical protein